MGDEGFAGLPKGLKRFLLDLAANNDKAWFDSHRADYEREYLGPGRAFVDELAMSLDGLFPGESPTPVSGSLFRIFRDTRFSKDKTPYKTHLAASFGREGRAKRGGFGYYVHIDAASLWLGGGVHAFSKLELEAYRRAAVDETMGPGLRRAVAAVTAAGFEISGDTYKRVPRGFDPEHENADLLLHSGLYAGASGPWPHEMHSVDFVDHCVERLRGLGPLAAWLDASLPAGGV